MTGQAVNRPPPERVGTEEMSRALAYFPDKLESALVRVRPEGAAELLLRIVDLRCAQRWMRLQGFDQTWAMITAQMENRCASIHSCSNRPITAAGSTA